MLPPITTFEKTFGPARYFMAPMAGITDIVFRTLIREMGAQVVISELLSCEGLVRGGKKTFELMEFSKEESPVGIQLFGNDVEIMCRASSIVEQKGADFVDINFGCPVKKVVCDGGGAAWLKDPIKLSRLLTALRRSISIPLSIKVRTGWDETSINVGEVVDVAADCGVEWVAIHGRTRAQGYSGQADWELIRKVAQNSRIPVIGNGDILTAEGARARLEQGYSHAVMIGRGALKNPWIFQESLGLGDGERNLPELIARHFDLAIEKRDRTRAFLSLKKFLAWYAAGYPYSSAFRGKLFQTKDVDELRQLALDYFQGVAGQSRTDDGQPFLMGGHG